jgi:hypothetical protein
MSLKQQIVAVGAPARGVYTQLRKSHYEAIKVISPVLLIAGRGIMAFKECRMVFAYGE